mgnify:CR=1 FL=1
MEQLTTTQLVEQLKKSEQTDYTFFVVNDLNPNDSSIGYIKYSEEINLKTMTASHDILKYLPDDYILIIGYGYGVNKGRYYKIISKDLDEICNHVYIKCYTDDGYDEFSINFNFNSKGKYDHDFKDNSLHLKSRDGEWHIIYFSSKDLLKSILEYLNNKTIENRLSDVTPLSIGNLGKITLSPAVDREIMVILFEGQFTAYINSDKELKSLNENNADVEYITKIVQSKSLQIHPNHNNIYESLKILSISL